MINEKTSANKNNLFDYGTVTGWNRINSFYRWNRQLKYQPKNVVILNQFDRTFIIGKIEGLVVEDNYYSFWPVNILMIFIYISSHSQCVILEHIKIKDWGIELRIEDARFRGILKPNFICGVFCYLG